MRYKFGERELNVCVFSLLFPHTLSFVFEGKVMYDLAARYSYDCKALVFTAIFFHFAGLLCGFFIKNEAAAKKVIVCGCSAALALTFAFFFPPSALWAPAFCASAFVTGAAIAAWGYFLKSCTGKNERIKTCADALIFSNIIMIVINAVSSGVSAAAALMLLILTLGVGILLAFRLPVRSVSEGATLYTEPDETSLFDCMKFLCVFVVILTVDSGLMYQVLNPAFAHLESLAVWYWAMPYVAALAVMRGMPLEKNRSKFLYAAMFMIVSSFVAFMFLGRDAGSYLVVNTLMLGACGVFDLFWWSIAGEMLDYSRRPSAILGGCLAANVMGVLLGGLAGSAITGFGALSSNVAVIALLVVCVTIAMLPALNNRLLLLLKNHQYLSDFYQKDGKSRMSVVNESEIAPQLTAREKEVLGLLLSGKSVRLISEELALSENTVKTHVKKIYGKYEVSSRPELIVKIMGEKQA